MERAEIERILAPDDGDWMTIFVSREESAELLRLALLGKRVEDAPVVCVYEAHDGRIVADAPGALNGQRVALVGVE